MFRHRPRPASPTRSLLRMLLALCVAFAPIVSAACDVHEAQHVAAGALPHADDVPADRDGDGEDRDPWHALMHASHCCGHAAALPTPSGVSGAPILAPVRLPDLDWPRPASIVSEPFRPPIRG